MSREALDQSFERIQQEHERQILMSASMAQLQASQTERPPQAGVGGPADFPPDPGFLKGLKILGRYAEEAIRHAGEFSGFSARLAIFLATPEGQKLIARLKDDITNHKDDPTLFQDLLKALGGGLAGYGSLQLGIATEAHLGAGIAASTGVAVPLKDGSKVKWFSGLEKSGGLSFEVTVALQIGQRTKVPTQLKGQFYGAHVGLEIGAAMGLNVYFDTSDDLHYEGFSYTVGIGFGAGISVLSGFEIVTSD